MSDLAQTNLREPAQVDWENYGKSSYAPPPPALDAAGNKITYYGKIEAYEEDTPDDGFLNYKFDPIKIVNSGAADGYQLRFVRASAKPFTKKGKDESGQSIDIPIKGNPNKLANFLRATGLQAKPQTNAEYRACVKQAASKTFPFTVDWEAYNKDTGESVKGYQNFPEDPERPGQKKTILHKGDVLVLRDKKGNQTGTQVIASEVLFVNAKLQYFQDPAPKVAR